MSEPPSLRERWLTELRRELRPLGRRRRRDVLAEAGDHLISAIEDEIAAGASLEEAEQRAVARFGEPATIGASLRAVRPRRRSRLAPAAVAAGAITAVLALAAGPIADGIAPRPAVAAESPGPSPRRCARAFDQSANVTVRQLVSGSTVLRVQIIPTSVPSCVIRFQLSNRRVLTAQSPWRVGTATAWDVTIHRNGLVGGGGNAVWRGGRLTATGPDAGAVVRLGPAPTVDTCVDAWNAAPPTVRGVTASRPALVQAFTGGVYIGTGSGATLPGNGGYACAVWLAGKAGNATLVTGAWHSEHAASWGKPIRVAGMFGGTTPNADMTADGRLTVRTPPTTRKVAPNPSANPGVTRQIGATGWAGGLKLHDRLAAAVRRFGTRAQMTPRGLGCQVSWPALGLSAVFEFGFVRKGPHRQQPTPCGPTAMAMSFTGAGTWSTSRGLRVGAPESDVARLYPGASQTTSSATGVTTYYLVPRNGRPSALSLTAQVALGSVTSITVAAGGVTFGFDIIG